MWFVGRETVMVRELTLVCRIRHNTPNRRTVEEIVTRAEAPVQGDRSWSRVGVSVLW